MSSLADMKAELSSIIAAVENRKQLLDSLISSLREAFDKLEEFEGESVDLFGRTPAARLEHAPSEREGHARLARSASRRGTQFHRIVGFFLHRGNEPADVATLATEIEASRSATTNILYRTQKEAFVSSPARGGARRMLWKVHPLLFEMLSERNRQNPGLWESAP